jgi:hypothetical protein
LQKDLRSLGSGCRTTSTPPPNQLPMSLQLWCTVLQQVSLLPCFLPQPDQLLSTWLSSTQQLLPSNRRKYWTSLVSLVRHSGNNVTTISFSCTQPPCMISHKCLISQDVKPTGT